MKSAGKARNNGLYRHIRTSKEIIRNLLNDYRNDKSIPLYPFHLSHLFQIKCLLIRIFSSTLLLNIYAIFLLSNTGFIS